MAVITDHPLRLRRIRADLSQSQLAELAGVSRQTIAQVEAGRTRVPAGTIFTALARRGGVPAAVVVEEFNEWQRKGAHPELSASARRVLSLPADTVAFYPSFVAWRETIAPNPTAFASLLHLPRTSLIRYEADRSRSMPPSLYRALTGTLRLSPEYVHELELLHGR